MLEPVRGTRKSSEWERLFVEGDWTSKAPKFGTDAVEFLKDIFLS
jgi:hypothetical protein